MQVPMGDSGVQAVPNTLHSQGRSAPLSTSPHWHALGSATRRPGTPKRASASQSASPGARARALWAMNPRPRHSKWGRSTNASRISSSPRRLPAPVTARRYWFSTSQRPPPSWRNSMATPWRTSTGSNPATTSGRRYWAGTKR